MKLGLLAYAAWWGIGAACFTAGAAEPVAAPAPPSSGVLSPRDRAVERSVKFTRQDALLWQARLAELSPQWDAARTAYQQAEAVLQQAQRSLHGADQDVAAAQAALQKLSSSPANPPAAPSAAERKPAVPAPGKTSDNARDKTPPAVPARENLPGLLAAQDKLTTATAAQRAARRILTETEVAVKQAKDRLAKLETARGEAQRLQQQAAERSLLLEKKPVTAQPEAGRLLQSFPARRTLLTARFDPDGRRIFAGQQGSEILCYDIYHGDRQELAGHHSWVGGLACSPVAPVMVTAGYNGHLLWWHTQSALPAMKHDVVGHRGFVRAVAFSPDGRFLASCGNDEVVRVWTGTGNLVRELRGHASHVYNVAFHPSGKTLVSGDLMGKLREWDVATWRQVGEYDASLLEKYDEAFRAHCGGIRSLDFSPEGKQLVVSGVGEVTNAFAGIGVPTALLFDCATHQRLAVMKPRNTSEGPCWGIRFSPTGDFIVGAGGRGSGQMWFWKPGAEKAFFELSLPNVPYDLDFHPDGLRVVLPFYDSLIRVYDFGPALEKGAASPLPVPTSGPAAGKSARTKK